MLPLLNVGPLAIQVPGLVLLVGLWLGISLAEKFAPRHGVDAKTLYNLIFISLIAGVIGARLAYVIRYTEIFASNPASLFSLNPGLLDPIGGFFAAIIVALIYGQRKGLALWPTLDALTPAFAVFAVALGFSHLASGVAFGSPTDLPWGIDLWAARRHPTQVYEILAAGLILAVLWPSRFTSEEHPPGTYFLQFIASSAGARLIIEAFRGDSSLIPGGFRTAQVMAWFLLALSLWAYKKLQARGPNSGSNT